MNNHNKQKLPVDVVIVGNIAFDVNTFPGRGNVKEKTIINNGGAGYYSVIPASLFARTGIVARVGYDFDMQLLKDRDIDLEGLKVIGNSKTTKFHHTYMSEDGQTRTFRPEVYEDAMIVLEDFPKEYYDAKYIHIATNFPIIQKQFVSMIRKYSNAKISIDTHEAYMEKEPELIKEIFDMVDIAFIDKEFKTLLDCKAPVKIIKMGKRGCKYIDKENTFVVATEERKVIDKTGAGDVVTGVLLAMLSRGENTRRALEVAVKTATKSIGDYGVEHLINTLLNRC